MALFKKRTSGKAGAEATATPPAQSIDLIRRRARHRLIGAAVLVLLGVVGFPLLFDSQPRPVAVDIAIEIPDKAKVKPLVLATTNAPAATPTAVEPEPAASVAASAEKSIAKPAVAAVAAAAAATAPLVVAKPASTPVQPKPAVVVDNGAKARALLDAAPAPVASAPSTRFVVQVGAFSDAAKLREVRQKLEKTGLKTYTQVVDTKDGKRTRVRIGPFTSQAEADKVAARIKALSLGASVLKM
jgi:DedD protein